MTDPSVAVLAAVNVRVEVLPVVEAGLKTAVTPVDSPATVNATLLVKPLTRAMVIVLLPLAPRLIDSEGGFAEIVKSGCGGWVTVRLIGTV
jgi:hypothetical protein